MYNSRIVYLMRHNKNSLEHYSTYRLEMHDAATVIANHPVSYSKNIEYSR